MRHQNPHWPYAANLAYGVTTAHDPYSSPGAVIYGELVEGGDLVGPRMLGTGPGIRIEELIDSPLEAGNVLERVVQAYGNATIKEYVVGNRLKRQWFLQAAHDLGLKTTVEGDENLKLNINQAIDGYSGVEHTLVHTPLYRDVRELFARLRIH